MLHVLSVGAFFERKKQQTGGPLLFVMTDYYVWVYQDNAFYVLRMFSTT